jgi:hypothetical protein
VEDGHSTGKLSFELEPILEDDVKDNGSSKEIGVTIWGYQLGHTYLIKSISEKSLELREFDDYDLRNINKCRGKIFTRRFGI